ncbi:alpha/beta fold hydrolase [Aeromicrobium sp.]|uniref:alpha/beta fold hydrolase n=1 Tax=Aeromicrobium sp. TaxID=1871063 RepID=UPI003D6AE92F
MDVSRIVDLDGISLYTEVHGDGPPSLLGIHGTPSSVLLWVDAAKELAHHGRCIIYDRRGFGRSERPDPFDRSDLDENVTDALALLEQLSATPAVVIGRSTGGVVALELARRHPDAVSALVLLEPALFTVDPAAKAWAERLRAAVLASASRDPARASESVMRTALGDETWESFPDDLRTLFAEAGPAVLAEMRGTGLDLSAEPLDLSDDELAAMERPTLLVSSEDSPDVLRRVNDRLAEALPNAETALVPGGHLIHPAHPVVLGFVDRLKGE